MKNKKLVLIIISAIVLCAGIVFGIIAMVNSTEKEPEDNQTKVTAEIIKYNKDTYKQDLIDAGLKDFEVIQTEKGITSEDGLDNNKKSDVYVYNKVEKGVEMGLSYLVARVDENILLYKLNIDDFGSYDTKIYLADVDGDKIDEVIVSQKISQSGGYGSFISQILKFSNNKIERIFITPDLTIFDTGFDGYFEDGLKLRIENSFVNLAETADLQESSKYGLSKHSDGKSLLLEFEEDKFSGDYYDDKGNVNDKSFPKDNNYLNVDTFYEFYPEDVDNDGVFELIAMQYTCLQRRSDFVGAAKSVLKYDNKSADLVVVNADFIPAGLIE